MLEQNETYLKQLGKMDRPIPGSSLTNSPESPMAFEQAPEFVNKKDALEELFFNMTREDVYVPMMEAVAEGATIMETTQVILFEGFRQGKWNPDLFLLLIEPTAYMIMALAERAEIDYDVDRDYTDEDDPDTEIEEKFERIGKRLSKGKIDTKELPKDFEERIESLPDVEPMVSRRKAEPEGPMEEGLISRRA